MIDYVTLSLFYATDISFICLMTCVDNKPLERCKISVACLLEQCEDAFWSNYMVVLVDLYGYIKYGFVLSTIIFRDCPRLKS